MGNDSEAENLTATFIALGVSQAIFFVCLPIWWKLTAYLHPVVLVVVWICVTGVVFLVVFLWKKKTIRANRKCFSWGLTMYTIALLALLFFRPSNQSYGEVNLVPFKTIAYFLSGNASFLVAFYNLVANVALFIPYGVFLPMLLEKRKNRFFWFVIGPIISVVMIETTQWLFRRGSLDVDDLILNVVGVYIGYGLSNVVGRVLKLG